MPSMLATRLLEVPRPAGDVSDVIWRNADLTQANNVTCVPSPELVAEIVSLYLSGDSARAVGQHLPHRRLIDQAITNASADLKSGLAENRLTTREQLITLASTHKTKAAAERIATLNKRRDAAAQSDITPMVEALTSADVTGVAELFAQDSESTLAALTQVDRSAALGMIERLDPRLHGEIMLAWATQNSIPIDSYLAAWLTATPVRAETLLGAMSTQQISQRCTGNARGILADAGILQRKESAVPAGVPLDQMAVIMSAAELAGMYVGSVAPVSPALERNILQNAPATVVLNFLLGSTMRKPTKEQALDLIRQAPIAVREAWAADLAGRSIEADLIAHGSASVALALLSRGETLSTLPYAAVKELSGVIDEILQDQPAAWEFLLVLSEEWEGSLLGLLEASDAMEREAS